MPKKGHTEEQIVAVLRQYAGFGVSELRELRATDEALQLF
jgi:hypothetical protein